ncbi:MAG: HAD-IC family P-type ATPase, partial [Bacteroidales bacterium]
MRKNGVRVEVEDNHQHGNFSATSIFLRGLLSLLLLIVALLLEHLFTPVWFTEWLKPLPYLLAYLPVGLPVIKEAIESLFSGELFSEFLLMTIATIGAFAIGEYPEAVAVMLFYTVGEGFQTLALNRARGSIEALIDERPDFVTLLKEDERVVIAAQEVDVEERVELKPGEKVALDGILISQEAFFDTSSLTGESAPSTKRAGEVVLAGMINLNRVAVVEVTTPYNQSKLSEILQLIEQASQRKAPTELFIRKFAKYYTPFVIFAALAIVLIPLLFVANYNFSEWLYRALIFLVISCPCALVISIPLGYFGGIGAAGKKGVLFKGGNYLDALAEIQHIAFD